MILQENLSSNSNALIVSIPTNGSKEIQYMLRIYLEIFLGISYQISKNHQDQDTSLAIGDRELTIRNAFWRKATPEYSVKDIPQKVTKSSLQVGSKKHPSVCIYGNNQLAQQDKKWVLDNDILANGFFMLTRWEESINKVRDQHDRFPSSEALAVKENFLDRPIVNEYTELLWAILMEMGIKQARKKRTAHIVPTHDVDMPYYFKSTGHYFKKTAWHLSKMHFKEASTETKVFLSGQDPYDYHEKQMSDAEIMGVQASFFFMTGGSSKYDPAYQIGSKKITSLIAQIQNRGHHIGLHPSYDTYNNLQLFREEKQRLEETIGNKITTGRQHYLRFSIPETWRIWEESEMEWDSTLGYAGMAGFRCGVCYDFPVYDFQERKELNLIEQPLIMMDVSLKQYENLGVNDAIKKVEKLKSMVSQYNGSFVYLWHNSSYEKEGWEGYNTVYERTLNSKFDSLSS